MQIFPITRRKTYGVKVGQYQVGGGAPVVVQSMTNTDTADIAATVAQCKELADAGSELVRITVNMPESAATVAEGRVEASVFIGLWQNTQYSVLLRSPP